MQPMRTFHPLQILILFAVLPLLLAAPLLAQTAAPSEEDLIALKCQLCHSGHRVLTMDPAKMKEILERMQKKNPDWITNIDSDHIAKQLATLLGQPDITSMRAAWQDNVALGKSLYEGTSLGTTGKACSACHPSSKLIGISDAYPKFDPKLKRFISLTEKINMMLKDKMKGKELGPGDAKLTALEIYIKSLK